MQALLTFRNKNFTKRNYECSNIAACQAPFSPGPQWEEVDEDFIANMQALWRAGDVRYFGWL